MVLKMAKLLTRKATLVEGKHWLGAALHSPNCYLLLPSQLFNFILFMKKRKKIFICRDLKCMFVTTNSLLTSG